MLKNLPKYIYRKDIANLLECSVIQVRKGEARMGLDKARRDINSRVVRYLTSEVIKALLSRGLIEPENN